jgi:26S proteasome non-ATPase regulatory subunit 10
MDGVESIEVLLSYGADPNLKDGFGDAPFHYAIKYGNYDSVTAFINNGVNINIKNLYGRTPLHLAAVVADPHTKEFMCDILELLIESGAHIDATDIAGETPLFAACKKGNTEGVKILLYNGANINHININDQTCINLTEDPETLSILENWKTHNAQ